MSLVFSTIFMIMKLTKGFTLIELLVVFAVIGILSSFVLAQLNSSRTKATDSKVRQTLNNAASKAQLTYELSATESWANTCSTVQTQINTVGGQCANTAFNYRIYAAVTGGYWCVDSTATKRLCTAVPPSTSCPSGC